MATAREDTNPPMAEPGRRAAGASTGGVARNADGGLADALQRSSERGDDDATGTATSGEAASAGAEPRLDLGGEPGSTDGARVPAGSAGASATPPRRRPPEEPRDRDIGEHRTPRADGRDVQPPDESPLESLGRSIAEPLAGADDPGVPGDGAVRKR